MFEVLGVFGVCIGRGILFSSSEEDTAMFISVVGFDGVIAGLGTEESGVNGFLVVCASVVSRPLKDNPLTNVP